MEWQQGEYTVAAGWYGAAAYNATEKVYSAVFGLRELQCIAAYV